MNVGSLTAEAAFAFVHGNDLDTASSAHLLKIVSSFDAEFSADLFRRVLGLFLFLGLPALFWALRTAEVALDLPHSRGFQYAATLAVLSAATLLLARDRSAYLWIIFLCTTGIAWVIYSEAMRWLLAEPRRSMRATVAAMSSLLSAFAIPSVFRLLDVQPDWARHALSAVSLVGVLGVIVEVAVMSDTEKAGVRMGGPYGPSEPFTFGQ